MGTRDDCAVQEQGLHRFSPPNKSPAGNPDESQMNNYRHHDLCRRQSAKSDYISVLLVHCPLSMSSFNLGSRLTY